MTTVANKPPASPVLQRLIRGMGSTALQPLVSAFIQLGTVPFLLHSWGVVKYGDWITLSAIPGYIALTNLGFGDASGSEMTVQVASGDKKGALDTFHSSLALVFVICVAMLAVAAGTVWLVPWHSWIKLSTLSDSSAAAVVLIMAAYILVSQHCGVLESGYRCDGNFATGTTLGTLLRLIETIVSTVMGIVSGSLFWAAMGFLITRMVGTVFYAAVLKQKSPWISFRIHDASFATVKRLFGPAMGFMALPMASALTIHGFTILVASVLGSVAVTEFSTLRTLTRVNFQLMTVIAWATWPELSRAFGEGNISLARALHRAAYQSGLALSLLAGGALWCFGPFVYHLWLHNKVPFESNCFHILVLVTFANSLWFTSSVVPMSTNAHQRIAIALVIASAVCLGLGVVLTQHWGLTGAAIALLALDLAMSCIVLRTSLRQLQDRTADFFRAMLMPPSILSARSGE